MIIEVKLIELQILLMLWISKYVQIKIDALLEVINTVLDYHYDTFALYRFGNKENGRHIESKHIFSNVASKELPAF